MKAFLQGRMRQGALALMGLVAAVYGAAYAVPLPRALRKPASPLVLDSHGGWMRVKVTPDDGGMIRIPVQLDEVPHELVDAVLSFEDRRFRWHLGVDPLALGRALAANLRAHRVVSGGSTITMQIVRLLEHRPRTVRAKLVEVMRAVQLELRLSKRELLELYFNRAPYGGNLEGIGAASYFYYGKSVRTLTLDEVATLAALPNAPTRLDPRRGRDKLFARRNDVLRRMADLGVVARERALAAAALPVHAERRPAPQIAAHLAAALVKTYPGRERLPSTLDRALQAKVEALLAEHLARLSAFGISNGAAVVIENSTRKVRAYVGSKSFLDRESQGQVDGARALRSPGSTLKPFVYALAFDRGLIGVHTLLEDVPTHYKDWSPVDFDGQWRGAVPASEALAHSLNIPAVRLAEKLEPEGLVHLLAQAGFRAVKANPKHYGLAAVLGGVEVDLLELTNFYATLAEGGQHRRYRWLEDEPLENPRRFFTAGAAYLVAEILTDVRRPELPDNWKDAVGLPRLAWKTGTSYGRRDAWSIGFTPRWSVGVWVGNFDGHGVPELVGVEAAAPLLFAIAEILPGAQSDPWFERPPEVVQRSICALSGAPAAPNCPHLDTELALDSRAPRAPCGLHVQVEVDDRTGYRLCPKCRAGRTSHAETHVLWPAMVAEFMSHGDVLPIHDPRCALGLVGDGPVVRSPNDGDEFVVRPGVPEDLQRIALIGAAQSGNGPLYWFVDDQLIAAAKTSAPIMLEPVPGPHRIVAMDGEGHRTALSIHVRRLE